MAGVTTEFEPALVPELLVSDVGTSLEFWCTICGFEVRYDRPDEGFAYITRGSAQVMLQQSGVDRDWITAELQAPRGRGINFQITVPNVESIVSALRAAGVELFMQPETKWYRVGEEETGVRQFLVTDPDGYLIRFQSSLGRRLTAR
jgi:catechol 2,3-dioxygenase-like lactoylglutathione lyase family enzyme